MRRLHPGLVMTAALVVAIVLKLAGLIDQFQLDLAFLAYLGWAVIRLLGRRAVGPVGAVGLGLGLVGLLLGLRLALPGLIYMPYLAIVPANLGLAYLFAQGLRPGREPVLLQLIRLIGMHPVEDPGFRRFVVRQCALWSGMTLMTAALALGAMVWAEARAPLATGLSWLIGAQVGWFLLSHYYAGLRYGRPETWLATLRAMTRPDILRALRA